MPNIRKFNDWVSLGEIVMVRLTQGKYAFFDPKDWEKLRPMGAWAAAKSRYTWYAVHHNVIAPKKRKFYKAHRIITDCPDNMKVDHKNGDGLYNVPENLRVCTNQENCQNSKVRWHNKTGYRGVSWNNQKNMYAAKLRINGVCVLQKFFSDPIDAAKAYDLAAIKYNGRFARLNFPTDT